MTAGKLRRKERTARNVQCMRSKRQQQQASIESQFCCRVRIDSDNTADTSRSYLFTLSVSGICTSESLS